MKTETAEGAADELAKKLAALSPERRAAVQKVLAARTAAALPAAIPRAPRDQPLPVSFAQRRLWFLDRLDPDSGSYNEVVAIRLVGALAVDALARSFEALVHRHEALRTGFSERDGDVMQIVADRCDLPLATIDLTHLEASVREREALARASTMRTERFDLGAPPFARATLFRLDDFTHVLVVVLHHVIADGWSLGVFQRELSLLYTAFREGGPSPLAELPIQYADYAVWQRTTMRGGALDAKIAAYREALAGAPLSLELPTDRPRAATQRFRGAQVQRRLPADLAAKVAAFAREERATSFMVLLAAFSVLLARLSGQDDVVVGTPHANRDRPEVEGLLGFFVNTLVVRLSVGAAASFRDLVAQTRKATLVAFAQKDTPFEAVVEALAPTRDTSRNPLFQVLFNVLPSAPPPLQLGDLDGTVLTNEDGVGAKLDLTLYVKPDASGMTLAATYDADLFDRPRMDELLAQLELLISEGLAAPDAAVSALSSLTERAREILPDPSLPLDEPALATVPALFAAVVDATPDAPAISHAGRTFSYRELASAADRVARAVVALGVAPREAVALTGAQRFATIAAMLGVLRAGAVLVPIDRDLPSKRRRAMIEEAGVKLVVAIGPDRADDRPDELGVPLLRLSAELESDDLPTAELGAGPFPDDPAYVFFTSGTTGVPKGVLGCHKGVSHFVSWQRAEFALGPGDRFAQLTGLSFNVLLRAVLTPLVSGALLCLPDELEDAATDAVLPWVARERITVLHVVPSLTRVWVAGAPPDLRVPTLRLAFSAGEPLTDAHVLALRRVCPNVRVVLLYGQTETTLAKLFFRVPDDVAPGVQPAGRAIPHAQALVLSRSGRRCGVGEVGEVVIRTPFRTLGYLRSGAATFSPNPFRDDPTDLVYRTGDLGRVRPSGLLDLVGRADDQVKIRGIRVEPAEVAAVILAAPGVSSAFVSAAGEDAERKRLIAYVVLRETTLTDVRAYLVTRLPPAMIPSAWVELPSMPIGASGKVDRRALPRPEALAESRPRTAPHRGLEEQVAAAFKDVLGVADVAREDDFFALGGHSLLATRLVARLGREAAREIPLRAVFEAPTVAELAVRVAALAPAREPIRPAVRDGALALSFAQERLWFLDRLDPGSSAYNLAWALRLEGDLRVDLLDGAFRDLVARHEILRTTFVSADGPPAQIVAREGDVGVEVRDLSSVEVGARDEAVRCTAREEASRSFDLAAGPLLRAIVLRLAERESVLLFSMHHVVSDGWSERVLVKELSELYAARLERRAPRLAPLPIQYADYAAWQRRWLEGGELDRQLAFWRDRLAGAPAALELPTDRPRPPVQSFRGAKAARIVAPALLAELRGLARAEGVTLFTVIAALVALLLGRLAGQTDVVIGIPHANRDREETQGLIGFFVNTLLLRLDVSGDPTVRELIARAKEASLAAFSHQDAPFEKVVEALAPARDPSRNPLFQALFNMAEFADAEVSLPGVSAKIESSDELAGSKLDLTLYARPSKAGLELWTVFNADLFDVARMDELLAQLDHLFAQASARPDRRIDTLSLVTDVARGRLPDPTAPLVEPVYPTVVELVRRAAERSPGAPAIRHRGRTFTYAELVDGAERIALHLAANGVRRGDAVGLVGEQRFASIAAMLGVLRRGAVLVPLDRNHPDVRQRAMLTEANAVALLVVGDDRDVDAWRDGAGIPLLRLDAALERPLDGAGATIEPPRADEPAYVFFTSGTTGVPKGILGSHKGIGHFVTWQKDTFAIGPGDRFAQLTGSAFNVVLRAVFTPLASGALLVLPDELEDLSSAAVLDLLDREAITGLHVVPSLIQAWLAHGDRTVESVRLAFSAGEPLTAAVVDRMRAAFPSVTVVLVYGQTETTMAKTCFVVPTPPAPGIQPAGIALPDTQALVLAPSGRLCGIGELGEVVIRTPFRTLGYLRTGAATFSPNPHREDANDLVYRTGDLGRYRSDGVLTLVGRADDQVKIRGIRVEPNEVTSTLLLHPGVAAGAVVAVGDDPEHRRLVAYVVARSPDVDRASIRGFLAARLPHAMVPSAIVQLEDLPLNANGKVDRRRLPPAPDGATGGAREPNAGTESVIAGVFSTVLRVAAVSATASFFELGGHSLLATQAVASLQHSLGVALSLRQMFETPTVEGLAAHIEAALAAPGRARLPELAPSPRDGPLPLSHAQERLWVLDRLDPGGTGYNIVVGARVPGHVDVAVLEKAFVALIARHESLRTTFEMLGESPVQRVHSTAPATVTVEDVSATSEEAQRAAVEGAFGRARRRRYNLETLPLVCAHVVRAPEEDVLVLAAHHILLDGWSLPIIVRDLGELYDAELEGRAPRLPILPIQYGDYAAWQRTAAVERSSTLAAASLADDLAGAPAEVALPRDLEPAARRLFPMGTAEADIEPSLWTEVKVLATSLRATPFVVALGAFELLLSAWTGARDLVVGTVVANRDRAEVHDLVGVFVNFLALRARVEEGDTAATFLSRLRKGVLASFEHQACPFEKVVAAANPDRARSRNPLYNVAFLLQAFAHDAPASRRLVPIAAPREAAVLDLRFVVTEGSAGPRVSAEFDAELFEPETMHALVAGFLSVLRAIVERPAAAIADLPLPRLLAEQAARSRDRAPLHTLAIAATFTAEPLEEPLAFWLEAMGLRATVAFAPYNQVHQELLDPRSAFGRNRRGVNVVLLRWEDWGDTGDPDEIAAMLADAGRRLQAPLVVVTCPASNDERARASSERDHVLATRLSDAPGVTVITAADVLARYPTDDVLDRYADELGKVPYAPELFAALATQIARSSFLLLAPPRKVIVTDLDNTLWTGVCGEDGPMGVSVSPARRRLQDALLEQRGRGVLLGVASRNNEDDALEVFTRRTDMPLQRGHFTCFSASWGRKSFAIRNMARELGLGLDAFVFLDDDPVQCAEVSAELPDVLVLQVPADESTIPGWLDHLWVLDARRVTDEDRHRAARYAEEAAREEARGHAGTLGDFIERLGLEIQIEELSDRDVARVAQLTQRTNQFNTTTIRRTEAEVASLSASGATCLTARVKDRFGDYGLVGAVVLRDAGDALEIESFLLSCRALGRGVEHAIVARVGALALSRGKGRVTFAFAPTAKNRPAADFLNAAAPARAGTEHSLDAQSAASLTFTADASAPAPVDEAKPVPAASPRTFRSLDALFAKTTALSSPAQLVAALAGRRTRVRGGGPYCAPRDATEEELCAIYAEVLLVARVGVHDDFFALGGHSLAATRVLSRIRDRLGAELPLRAVFEAPTVAALANVVAEARVAELSDEAFEELLSQVE